MMLALLIMSPNLDLIISNKTEVLTCVLIDPIRLKQILINLISNGIKYTDKGGVYVEVSGNVLDSEKGILYKKVSKLKKKCN